MKRKKFSHDIRVSASIFTLIIIGVILLLAERKYEAGPVVSGNTLDEAASWHLYQNSQFGFSLKWPREILPRDPQSYDSGPRAPGYAYIPVHSNFDIFAAAGSQITGGNMTEVTRRHVVLPEEKNYPEFKKEPIVLGSVGATRISYRADDGRNHIVIFYEDGLMKLLLAYEHSQPDFDEALFDKVAQTLTLAHPGASITNAFEATPSSADFPFAAPSLPAAVSSSLSAKIQTANWETYRNNEDGYSIRHPNDFITGEGVALLHAPGTTVGTTFSIPATYIEAGKFYSASIHIATAGEEACEKPPDGNRSEYVADNGSVFVKTEKSEGAAGQLFSQTTYATTNAGTCYRIIFLGAANNPEAALAYGVELEDAQRKILEDEKKLREILEAMLGTFSFANASDAGDLLRVDAVTPSPIAPNSEIAIVGNGFAAQPPGNDAGWLARPHVTVSLADEAGNSGTAWEGNPISDTELLITLPSRLCKTKEVCEPALEIAAGETYVLTVAIPYLGRQSSIPVTIRQAE